MYETLITVAESAIGIALLTVAITFGYLYNKVSWYKSYVGWTTMLGTLLESAFLGVALILLALDLGVAAHLILLIVGAVGVVVVVRKTKSLRAAQKELRERKAKESLIMVELHSDNTQKEEE